MKPTRTRRLAGKKRRLVGWLFLVLAAAMGSVWIASNTWGFEQQLGSCELALDCGEFKFSRSGAGWGNRGYGSNWFRHDSRERIYSWGNVGASDQWLAGAVAYWNEYGCYGGYTDHYIVRTSLLTLSPACAGVGLLGWGLVAARRPRKGHCPYCNYNLRGLPPNTPCPECGQ